MNIRLEGLDEVLESLDSLIDESTLEAALGKACAVVEATAKQKAPKDTGELRRSITSKVELQGDEMVGVVYTRQSMPLMLNMAQAYLPLKVVEPMCRGVIKTIKGNG